MVHVEVDKMAEQFKIDGDGQCKSCREVPAAGETIPCYSCSGIIHAICTGASTEDRVATKTMVNCFLLTSTKRNFVFYCDICLTKMEINQADSESKRVSILEEKMEGIDKQLSEIMNALKESKKAQASQQNRNNQHAARLPKDNIWADAERLERLKAPEPKAVLVINKDANENKNLENQNIIEKLVLDNAIPLTDSHKRESGDMVLVGENKSARDTLKDLVRKTESPQPRLKLI